MKQQRIAIVGGGASGMMAAILIKRELPNHQVTIYECQNKVGKKILQTGNGRCNLTNQNIDETHYNNPFVKHALTEFDYSKCQQLFNEFGLLLRSDTEGRVYPYSEKATTVLDILLQKISQLGVKIVTDTTILELKADVDFTLCTARHTYHADYVIIACGGISNINYQYHGYEIIKKIGHEIVPVRAGLVALKTKENTKALSGVRIKGKASLIIADKTIHQTTGEILFKDHGLSGIAVFELSRYYNEKQDNYIEIDLMPEYSENQISQMICSEEDLLGFFPKMINYDIIKRKKDNNISLSKIIKHYRFTIDSCYDFKNAQITMGGASLDEIDPLTYQSLRINKVYLIGEIVNIDGSCGGYNLHFAWASAYVASRDIIRKIKG